MVTATDESEARPGEVSPEAALLDAVVRQMPVGVVIADARTRRVVAANERVAELFGADLRGTPVDASAASVLSRSDGRAYAPSELPIVRALDRGDVVGAERIVFEGPLGVRLLSLNAAPVRDAAGTVVAAVAIVEDVTDRERRERAEREFVTNAAHELQTPLAGIASAIEVLQAGAKEHPRDRDRFLAHIDNETRRLTRLAHALLLLARAQTGVEAPAGERFALRPLLDEIALSLQPGAGVVVRVTCPARLVLTANRNLVEQTLSAVAANAAKYTQAGEICLEARREGTTVEVDISDTGPGIAADEQSRVFARFYRAGARTADGFGLGLAIARQAAEAVGGSVELVARDGGGTVARLRFPSAQQ